MWKKPSELPMDSSADTIATATISDFMRKTGFSIPELIIVIATIGILAGIVIVGYNGIQNKGHDAAVQSDLESVSGLIESYRTNPSNPTNRYPSSSAHLSTLGIKTSKNSYDQTLSNNFVYCVSPSSDNYQYYAIIAMSKSGNTFVMTADGFKNTSASPFLKTDFNTQSSLCDLPYTKGLVPLDLGSVSAGMLGAGNWQAWAGSN